MAPKYKRAPRAAQGLMAVKAPITSTNRKPSVERVPTAFNKVLKALGDPN
jgi:hypothetical protein